LFPADILDATMTYKPNQNITARNFRCLINAVIVDMESGAKVEG